MHIKIPCGNGKYLEIFSPSGHTKFLIQMEGRHPQDGVPYAYLDDLIMALQSFRKLLPLMAQEKPDDPYEQAAWRLMHPVDKFVPFIVPGTEDLAYFVLKLRRCAICGEMMVDEIVDRYTVFRWGGVDDQIKRAGWHLKSPYTNEKAEYMCEDCAKTDQGKFTCYLCGEVRPKSQEYRYYPHSRDSLCIGCFETRTAAEWDRAVGELEGRYE